MSENAIKMEYETERWFYRPRYNELLRARAELDERSGFRVLIPDEMGVDFHRPLSP